jgi:hypothetical protein
MGSAITKRYATMTRLSRPPEACLAGVVSGIWGQRVFAAVNRSPKVTANALRAAFQLIQICFELQGNIRACA